MVNEDDLKFKFLERENIQVLEVPQIKLSMQLN